MSEPIDYDDTAQAFDHFRRLMDEPGYAERYGREKAEERRELVDELRRLRETREAA